MRNNIVNDNFYIDDLVLINPNDHMINIKTNNKQKVFYLVYVSSNNLKLINISNYMVKVHHHILL